jgi:lipid-A-disaccharide synthase
MKFYIIAGEASGDLHASNLVKAIKHATDVSGVASEFRGFGGDRMHASGVDLVKHYRETAFMGFWEVVKHLRKIFAFIDLCKRDIEQWKPDALILVDYPGFNLRIAEWAHRNGYNVFYYISPQVWAWKESRVKKIKRDVDTMLVILPFEKDFYRKWNYDVEFVGHPLLDAVKDFKTESMNLTSEKKVVALLPGSRKQEIATMLPAMLQVVNDFPDCQFVIAGLSSVDKHVYDEIAGGKKARVVIDQTYSLLSHAHAALVTSGTATMETALFNVPQVVCYKGSALSYFIARRLVDVKYISLVNLVLDRPLVRELIQQNLTKENLSAELHQVLHDESRRNQIAAGYAQLREKLGGEGASQRAAAIILRSAKR